MRCSKFFIILNGLFFCCLGAGAQDSDFVYKDSSVIMADSIKTRSLVIEMKKNSVFNDNVVNAVLKNSQLSGASDSAEALKNAPSFVYAKNLDSILKALQKKQIARAIPANTNTSLVEKFFFSSVTKLFFWTLAVFFIGFILYKLFFTKGFFQRIAAINNVTVLHQEEEQLFATTDYNKLIAQSITNKNYRLAIRYHYLQTLQKLAAKGTIQFTDDKTNYQYLKELYGKPYENEFVSLTINYEYTWYGGFEIDETMFGKIQNNFKQFNIQL